MTPGSKPIARRFPSTPALRFFPQMRKYVGHPCTVVEINGDVALVEFEGFYTADGCPRFVWPVTALQETTDASRG